MNLNCLLAIFIDLNLKVNVNTDLALGTCLFVCLFLCYFIFINGFNLFVICVSYHDIEIDFI